MADSILVATCKQMVDAINAHRQGGYFELSDFVCDWEFSGRAELRATGSTVPEDWLLKDGRLHVRVMVPRRYEQVEHETRWSGDVGWVAAFDIDVRQKFGETSQDGEQLIEREALDQRVHFLEQLHAYFSETLEERRLELAQHEMWAEWCDVRDGVKKQSEVLLTYSPKHLREHRQYYGILREIFEITGEE